MDTSQCDLQRTPTTNTSGGHGYVPEQTPFVVYARGVIVQLSSRSIRNTLTTNIPSRSRAILDFQSKNAYTSVRSNAQLLCQF